MSHHLFGSGNNLYRLDSVFNERAGPRMPGTQAERRYRHPVVPISTTDAPHYAQASQLYPMRSSLERDNIYWYKPGSLGRSSQGNGSGAVGQSITIPVVHLGASKGSTSFAYNITSNSSENLDNPLNTLQTDNDESTKSPTFRTPSVITSGNRSMNRSTPRVSDPEAEVDALTSLLIQSMETRPSVGTNGILTSGLDGPNESPVGSLRRGSGLTQFGRLQQHVSMSPSSGGNVNSNLVNPITTGVTSASTTCSSSTNSPTESASSMYNYGETTGALTNATPGQNVCFRCRRSLVPPEGSTLIGNLTSVNNVVTLAGALGVKLHVACFTCYRCAAPLKSDAYYHNLKRLLCPACVRDGAVEVCSNCHRPIGDRVVHALGMPYHPSCFVCVVCAGRLDSRPFTIDVHGRLHCLTDFHKRYAPRCTSCGRPIVPDAGCQEARRVVSGNSNFHLECFGVQTLPQNSNIKSSIFKASGSVVS
ncbi:Zyxin [Schistosoma japonicum]|nr:Zyxin [Schistosoma japonicum]KAH8865491.1 Zyxin [Schistosoma japonicum]KAH8865492.1 Zyxin [Schistosoma japonicum]KAH8865493.1 Zyxin [Schistosoma japonicum]